jgi:hypothetical protein
MNLELKRIYRVNGIEYSSLEEGKKAIEQVNPVKSQDRNSLKKSFQIVSLENTKISEYMGKMNLEEANKLALLMSNNSIKFWVPSYSEMVSLLSNNKTDNWKDTDKYWTSSIFHFSTYIFYDSQSKEFDDIFPDLKLGVRFLFKEL